MYLENRILRIENICSWREGHEKEETSEIKISNKKKKKEKHPRNAIRGCIERLSKKERREDALALGAEERRDKLRKAAGRSKYPEIRGYLNGETHMERLHVSITE